MKKFILGFATAMGAMCLFCIHKKKRLGAFKIKGSVSSVNHDEQVFQIKSSLEKNVMMRFSVTPETKFMWLEALDCGSNLARFEDVSEGVKVAVFFVKDKVTGNMLAQAVIIEAKDKKE